MSRKIVDVIGYSERLRGPRFSSSDESAFSFVIRRDDRAGVWQLFRWRIAIRPVYGDEPKHVQVTGGKPTLFERVKLARAEVPPSLRRIGEPAERTGIETWM